MNARALAILAFALVVVGAATAKLPRGLWTVDDPVPPSLAEIRWAQRLYGWDLTLGTAKTDPTFGAILRCARDLRRVGPPPTKRLGVMHTLAARACAHYRRGALAFRRAGPSARSKVGEREFERGDRLFSRLEEILIRASAFNGNRRLPVRANVKGVTHTDPRFGRAATRLIGRKVEATCWSTADWHRLQRELTGYTPTRGDYLGFAGGTSPRVFLSSVVCDPLTEFVYRHRLPSNDFAKLNLATAVAVLSHESQHRAGFATEFVAECYGIQRTPRLARILGASPKRARDLVEAYWEDVYPYESAPYRSRECRNGGRLDLNRRSDVWP